MLKGVKHAGARLIDYNTVFYFKSNGTRFIRVDRVDVLKWTPEGTLTIDTQGMRSYLIKRRINQHQTRIKIVEKAGTWYFTPADNPSSWRMLHHQIKKFYDGLTIDRNHQVQPA